MVTVDTLSGYGEYLHIGLYVLSRLTTFSGRFTVVQQNRPVFQQVDVSQTVHKRVVDGTIQQLE